MVSDPIIIGTIVSKSYICNWVIRCFDSWSLIFSEWFANISLISPAYSTRAYNWKTVQIWHKYFDPMFTGIKNNLVRIDEEKSENGETTGNIW